LIALPLVIDMLVAYITADREALFSIFSSPDKFYGADPFIFWFVGLIILFFGPGKFSLDTLLSQFIRKKGIDSELGVVRSGEAGTSSQRFEGELRT